MMFLRIFLPALLLTTNAFADGPQNFSDPRQAIEAAKQDKKLIVFLLSDSFSREGKAVEEAVNDQLKNHGNEFVIVRCSAGSQAHRTMFSERFKKDVSRAPVAVVSNADGTEVTGCYGVKPRIYRKMLTHARIKAGFVKDQQKIIELREEILEGEDEELLVKSIFGIKKGDLRGKKVTMTPSRVWTYKNGKKFTAALLEGRGELGIFVGENGGTMEVKFNDLSEVDTEYLKTVLRFEETKEK
ncbi:MAG: hypothetical protein HKN23_13010 [Verrucomicrobiales bacterium]|nr:hypothetical protein [Verrucomicrobiales bacterium]